MDARYSKCVERIQQCKKNTEEKVLLHPDSYLSSETEVSSEESGSVSDVQFDLEMSDPERQPTTSKTKVVKDTVLISKAKQVSIRAQNGILK